MLRRSANVSVQAHWDPIADSFFNLHNESPQHAALCNLSPSHPTKVYGTKAFKVFIPASSVEVGDVWALDSGGRCSVSSPVSPRCDNNPNQRRGRRVRLFTSHFVGLCGNSFSNSCGVNTGESCRFRWGSGKENEYKTIGWMPRALSYRSLRDDWYSI